MNKAIFSKPLFKQSFKGNWVLWAVITGIMAVMMLLISGIMGPKMIEMMAAMPQGSGMSAGGTMDQLLAMMYYGNMALLLPMVYVIITANSLVASQVDRGSMAYTLSTPIKRTTVTITQMLYLLGATFAMFAVIALSHVLGAAISGTEINAGNIALLNLGGFLLQAAIGGIAFMASCIFNLSRNSLSVGAGIPVFFYIMSIVGQMGSDRLVQMGMGAESLKAFNNLTIMTLYDTTAILEGSGGIVWRFLALFCIAAAVFAAGHIAFKKKDLPL
jgi:ABC-2 type transport system permease protein